MPNHKIIHLSWWNEGSPLAKCRENLTYQGPTSSPILTIKTAGPPGPNPLPAANKKDRNAWSQVSLALPDFS